jgi:hypothetical protein
VPPCRTGRDANWAEKISTKTAFASKSCKAASRPSPNQWHTETNVVLTARLQRKRKKRTANTDHSLRSHAFFVCVCVFVTSSNLACHICPRPHESLNLSFFYGAPVSSHFPSVHTSGRSPPLPIWHATSALVRTRASTSLSFTGLQSLHTSHPFTPLAVRHPFQSGLPHLPSSAREPQPLFLLRGSSLFTLPIRSHLWPFATPSNLACHICPRVYDV